jgi:hypothetical protein
MIEDVRIMHALFVSGSDQYYTFVEFGRAYQFW